MIHSFLSVAASTLISPLEMIRTKMQAEKMGYFHVLRAVQIAVSQDGWRSLWRGLSPTLWRDVPFSGKNFSFERDGWKDFLLFSRVENRFGLFDACL